MKTQDAVKTATIALAAALCVACASQSARKGAQSGAPGVSQLAAAPIEASEPSLRQAALLSIPELKTVYFDFNSDYLKPEARAALKSNALWLKRHDQARIQVAGNCDQRGTVEYNLALGQRRASVVRAYYIRMGVAANRIATISYGKERPLCSEEAEACWQKNRRAENLEATTQNVSSLALPPAAR